MGCWMYTCQWGDIFLLMLFPKRTLLGFRPSTGHNYMLRWFKCYTSMHLILHTAVSSMSQIKYIHTRCTRGKNHNRKQKGGKFTFPLLCVLLCPASGPELEIISCAKDIGVVFSFEYIIVHRINACVEGMFLNGYLWKKEKYSLKGINRSISPPTNNILSMLTSKNSFSREFSDSQVFRSFVFVKGEILKLR